MAAGIQPDPIQAAKASADIRKSEVQTQGLEIDNAAKQFELMMQSGQFQQVMNTTIQEQVRQALAMLAPVQMAAIAQAANGGLPIGPGQPLPAGI